MNSTLELFNKTLQRVIGRYLEKRQSMVEPVFILIALHTMDFCS
jgi:GTP-binding protein EngB required for normal cell division